MASKRKLKKDVNFVTFELLTECFTLRHFHKDIDEKKFEDVIRDLVNKRNELIHRVNKPEIGEGESEKAYYRKIRTELIDLVAKAENLTK